LFDGSKNLDMPTTPDGVLRHLYTLLTVNCTSPFRDSPWTDLGGDLGMGCAGLNQDWAAILRPKDGSNVATIGPIATPDAAISPAGSPTAPQRRIEVALVAVPGSRTLQSRNPNEEMVVPYAHSEE
jgi:hypothetical protein